MEDYSAIKEEWTFAICDNMDGPGKIILSEMSQAEKDRYCMLPLLCGIQKIKQINYLKKKKIQETD